MGLALLWKARGPGSQELLGDFKRLLRLPGHSRTGIGHTGTLDPFAEGILCVGTGEGTKLLTPLMGLSKTYRASMILGGSSDTLDDTGTLDWHDFTAVSERLKKISADSLEAFLKLRLGAFDQLPPQYSAVHVDGKRAYEWARLGVEKPLKPRRCELLEAKHIDWRQEDWRGHPVFVWDFEVHVSSGTYIRCLARDWGLELSGRPALLNRLVRTRVGPFAREPGPDATWLSAQELQPLFELNGISTREAEEIRRFGRWRPQPGVSKPGLLMDPTGIAVAWTEAMSGRLGRVFTSDPLEIRH